ncbi:MAG: DUF2953 domain-containing protein [Eubacterium sp.]|nr:DUF2953 domain-containing protein [Eubacterium sp.]
MIVLTVLKWIGIVLLWILLGLIALALLILMVVLFVPFRYKVSVATKDEAGSSGGYGFHLTWILHAISIKKTIGSEQILVRILGIPIKRISGASPQIDNSYNESENEEIGEDLWDDEEFDDINAGVIHPETDDDRSDFAEKPDGDDSAKDSDETDCVEGAEEFEIESEIEKKSTSPDENPDNDSIVENIEKSEDNDNNTEYSDIKEEDKASIKDKINAIKQKINKKCQKFHFIFYKIHSIMSFVKSRATKKTIRLLLSEVVKMIRYVGPKRIEGHLEFGTGDPGYTGAIMAGVSLIKFSYKKNVSIVPNFEELCLIGDATLWGRIRVVYFLRMAIRIWFNRDFRDLRKQYRQMKRDQKKMEKQLSR